MCCIKQYIATRLSTAISKCSIVHLTIWDVLVVTECTKNTHAQLYTGEYVVGAG